ncbi:C-X-C chemokine receptor type 1 isoform X1 [Anguilla anguilla]|uniref:C-X-C chemokine receptor type 1 isoform X1 n=2 Tax=Anguilla anguilla TaxID=7936 RepID=UPI0015A77A93|nr:C-X-C chemokine receptor type 1 isoform X1 [Anguilla anguilla]
MRNIPAACEITVAPTFTQRSPNVHPMEGSLITAIIMEDMMDNDSYYYENTSDSFSLDDLMNGAESPCVPWTLGSGSVALACVYSAVFLFSLLGNGLVISVVSCVKGGRSSTDVYLMNLAAADLLFSATLPFWCVYLHSGWVFGGPLCKLLSGLQEATFYGGVLLLSCISVDRYLAVVKATQPVSRRRSLVGTVCGAVWLGAGLLALPALVQRQAFRPGNGARTVCHEHLSAGSMGEWRVGLRVLHHALGFFLPLAVMALCYGRVAAALSRARNRQKRRAVRVVLAVVLAFVACWLPRNVVVLADTLMRGGAVAETCALRRRLDLALQATEVLAFLHCALNPVLYAFIGQKFRGQLLRNLQARGLVGKGAQPACRRSSSNTTSFTL